MISRNEKMSVLKSICDYCGYKVLLISNKIVIDGRKSCLDKQYFIYNNLDEALIDLEEIYKSNIKEEGNKTENIFKYEFSVINKVKSCYRQVKFRYSSKLNILIKLSNMFSKQFFNFKFKGTDIIVTTGGNSYLFNSIDDILLKYQKLIKQYQGNNYKFVYDMILEKTFNIIKDGIDNDAFVVFKRSPYNIAVGYRGSNRVKYEKHIVDWCCDIIEIIDSELNIVDKKLYSDLKMKREYLNVCKQIVNRTLNIEKLKEVFVSSDELKISLAKKAIETIEDECCFEKVDLYKMSEDIYINIAETIINKDEMFTELLDYLIEKSEDENIYPTDYLNVFYDFIKDVVESNINKSNFFNYETEMYDVPKNINSIMHILEESEIPSDIIFANKDAVYITMNKDNSKYIVIDKNCVINYNNDYYNFEDVDSFIDFIKSILSKNYISTNCEDNSCVSNTLKSNDEAKIKIKDIFEVSNVKKSNDYYEFQMYCLVDDLNKANKNLNDESEPRHFIVCKIDCKNGIFNFNNMFINVILYGSENYEYDFTNEQINIIKKHITNYIVKHKLGNMNLCNINDEKVNRVDNTIKEDNIDYKLEILDDYIKVYLKTNNIEEKYNSISIPKKEIIEVILKDIDNTTILKELESRLQSKN